MKLFYLCCVLLNLLGTLRTVSTDRVVITDNGPLQGITVSSEDSQVEAFLGIPYAEPPTGRLRFQKPVPKSNWIGVYDASSLPPPCIQNASQKFYYMPNTDNMSEDCLYLNIWVPGPVSKELKPIIVWVHGGAFIIGSANFKIYDGSTLTNYGDIVVVTINYRIGALGFFAAFIDEADGNMGIYDQIEALKWIRRNAEAFGGDPKQITLMGQSAGAIATAGSLISPLTRNLFKRAILQSGAAIHPMSGDTNNERLLEAGQKLAKIVGCADRKISVKKDPLMVVECLKRLPAVELSRAEGLMMKSNPLTFIPRIGDALMPNSPTEYIKDGAFQDTEVLLGITRDEGPFFLTALLPDYFGVYGVNRVETITKRLAHQTVRVIFKFTEQTSEAEIADFYINNVVNDTSDAYTKAISEALGDYLIACNTIFHADFHSLKHPTYFYVFSHRPSSTFTANWTGTTHFEEIQYIFGNPLIGNFTPEELEMSRRMMDRWIAFVKTGDPNIEDAIKWPRYHYNDPEYLDIDIEEVVRLRPDQYRCEFWRQRFQAEIDDHLVQKLTSEAVQLNTLGFPGILAVVIFLFATGI